MKTDFELEDHLNPYETFVLDFWSSRRDSDSVLQNMQSLFVMGLGLPGETAEVLEHVWNDIYHPQEFDQKDLFLELGDVYYYLTRIGIKKGITEYEIHSALADHLSDVKVATVKEMEFAGSDDAHIKERALGRASKLSVEVGRLTELLKKEVRDNKLDHEIFKDTLIGVHEAFNNVLKHYDIGLEQIKTMNHEKLLDRKANGKAVKKVALKFKK